MTVPHVLSIVTLGVGDLDRSVRFYQHLGWRLASSSSAEIAWFDLGGPWLGLFGVGALAVDAGLPWPGSEPAPKAGSGPAFDRFTLALNVPDAAAVDAGLTAAVAAGGTLSKPGTWANWGGYSGYFADPDWHLWELAYNPMFPVRPDGGISIP